VSAEGATSPGAAAGAAAAVPAGSPAGPPIECAWCEPGGRPERLEPGADVRRIALLGNPNTGKTTLFNRISGLRSKTSNFPGTTLDARVTRVRAGVEGGRDGDLIDLPGIYSLELDQLESRVCREVLAGTAAPRGEPLGEPECAVVVVDALNLARNLVLVGELFRRRLPTLVVVNMIDLARKEGVKVDAGELSRALGCGVVLASARTGEGIEEIRHGIRGARIPAPIVPVPADPEKLRIWAEEMFAHAVPASKSGHGHGGGAGGHAIPENLSDRVDRVLLHPVGGTLVFAAVMTGLFVTIFSIARYPMDLLSAIFDWGKTAVHWALPAGALTDLLADGVLGGVGSVVMFLPQICLLFFMISLLEDTGYLARGAFLMDRLLRPLGLPGHAFVPLLSSHACALPGIMATRGIPDARQRLATILVAPFMTCSARLPVYVLLTTLLFRDRPLVGALAFVGCYALGMAAGALSALIARRTILRGKSRPMALELPCYKRPSLRTAAVSTLDRAKMFLKNAGTSILMICVVLWWLGAYPRAPELPEAAALRAQAARVEAADRGNAQSADGQSTNQDAAAPSVEALKAEADRLDARNQKTHSFLGHVGRTIEPVFRPLGFDWQLTVGVLASFAAREVFVSTMNVVVAGQEKAEDEAGRRHLMEQIQGARRDDGVTPIFTPAASWSLLVFFVLAMQCLPTLAVTARESGHVKWALLQLAWMSGVAYVAAMVVYQVMK
jgi:ferrous iron transport protein B